MKKPKVDGDAKAGALSKGTGFTTAAHYDPKVKAEAYELYLTTDYTIADIAIAVGVASAVVSAWAQKGGWRNRKLELEREEMHKAEDAYRKIILANRAPLATRHIRISAKLEEAVEMFADKLKTGGAFSDSEMKAQAAGRGADGGVRRRSPRRRAVRPAAEGPARRRRGRTEGEQAHAAHRGRRHRRVRSGQRTARPRNHPAARGRGNGGRVKIVPDAVALVGTWV